MSQFHLKFVLNCLNDESNLVQSLPTLIPSLLSTTNQGHDETSLIKLHTRISTLLQAKTLGLRWSGVCLANAALQRSNGGWDTLISHGSTWIKLLLKILERETNEVVIERTVSTISAMIEMTDGKPSLTRDLSTPVLPTFYTHMFSVLNRPYISNQLLKVVMYHVHQGLTGHSTTFRPFAGKLQSFTTKLINGYSTDLQVISLAAQCYASLHLCAPKNTSAEQWHTGFMAVLGECHATLSYIFQAVVEEKTLLPVPAGMGMLLFSSDYGSQLPLALRRLQALMRTLLAFLSRQTRDVVKIPLGQLTMLLERILHVNSRSGIKASTPQSSQVALISALPQLHAMTFDIARSCLEILGLHMTPHLRILQEMAIKDSVHEHEPCQVASISLLAFTVGRLGLVGDDDDQKSFSQVVRRCVNTLQAIIPPSSQSINSTTNGALQTQRKRKQNASNEGSDQISHNAAFHRAPSEGLLQASCGLIMATLSNTFNIITKGTRQQLDTTVLRLLGSQANLNRDHIVPLLKILKCSILASEASFSAAAVLTASLNTVTLFSSHTDTKICSTALAIKRDLEVLVHPRFPAIRRRVAPVEEDHEPYMETTHEEPVADIPSMIADQGTPEHELVAEQQDLPLPSYRLDTFEPPTVALPESVPAVALDPIGESTKIPAPTNLPEHAPDLDTVSQREVTVSAEPDQKKARLSEPAVSDFQHSLEPEEDLDEDMEGMPEICSDSDTDPEDE